MRWEVVSDRFVAPQGAVLTESDLAGCNIVAAVEAGHLVPTRPARKPRTPARAKEQ